MGDEGEFWKDVKAYRKRQRELLGVECTECIAKQPKRNPTILMPGQRCKVDGYRDPRAREPMS